MNLGTFRCVSKTVATPPNDPNPRIKVDFAITDGSGNIGRILPTAEADGYVLDQNYTFAVVE